jgi:hypothetical protein
VTALPDGSLDYALVSGHGRSGTNWLIELLDLSPQTFCRSEPRGIETSPLRKLEHDRFVKRADQSALDAAWDEAAHWTASHMGERDRMVTMPKHHIRELSRRLGLYRVIRGPRYRRALSVFLPSLRGGEWRPPGFVFDHAALRNALPIFKLVSSPGWTDWVLHRRPHVRVFHIVRHPGGYLHSWKNRYRSQQDEGAIARLNRARLEDIAREQPDWGARFGDVAAMSTVESELWFWCYASETIERAGAGKPAHLRIIYEELAANPVPIVRRCYDMCGLDWSEPVEQAVIGASQISQTIASKWRSGLADDEIEMVLRVLNQSTLRDHWPGAAA